MNKRFFLITSAATLTLLSSCLTTLHNLVTYATVIRDNRITGNWQYDNMTMKIETVPTSYFFKKMNSAKVNGEEKKSQYDSKEDSLLYSNSYIIDFTKNNYRYYMACSLTRIGNDLYADMEPLTVEPANKPTASDVDNLFDGGSYLTTHSIARIVFRGDALEIRVLNGNFIKDQLMNGCVAIKCEKDDLFATTLITSSSDELRQFLSKYGNDERLYSEKNTITLRKI